jgi:hypothetical protein
MSREQPQAPTSEYGVERTSLTARPKGPWWSPKTWFLILRWRWNLYGPVGPIEMRGYGFWGPVVTLVLLIELLAALSNSFKNAFPWPTISSTVGELEKRWDWVGVIVVGLLAVGLFQAIAYRDQRRSSGRAYRRNAEVSDPAEARPPGTQWPRYNWILVLGLEALAMVLAVIFVDSEFARGCIIYGVLGFFGILLPGLLAFWGNRIVRFPTLFFTVGKLRHRLHLVAVILVAGLSILALHLAFYPWPDLVRESASYAGLNSYQARTRAAQTLRSQRGEKPALQFSTLERTVVDGHDAWLVYFRPAGGVGPSCVVTVTKDDASSSAECLN